MQNATAAAVTVRAVTEPCVPADCSMQGLEVQAVDGWPAARLTQMAARQGAAGAWLLPDEPLVRGVTPGSGRIAGDDDAVLADAAMCDPGVWAEVRADLLRGWLRCSADGRLYHPVFCRLAAGISQSRQEFRASTATVRAARAAKHGRGAAESQASRDLRRPSPARASRAEASRVDVAAAESAAENSLRNSVDNHASDLGSAAKSADPRSATELQQAFECEIGSVMHRVRAGCPTQEHRARAQSAIPLLAEGDSFSRRPL